MIQVTTMTTTTKMTKMIRITTTGTRGHREQIKRRQKRIKNQLHHPADMRQDLLTVMRQNLLLLLRKWSNRRLSRRRRLSPIRNSRIREGLKRAAFVVLARSSISPTKIWELLFGKGAKERSTSNSSLPMEINLARRWSVILSSYLIGVQSFPLWWRKLKQPDGEMKMVKP